ncbi:biliverdin-producing heme oxygenase [Flavobacterium sp. AG291]|uniref:biliverdin-producing heme oxygenase n=1 Tax=Flavobacterium sp. AG291 TaxID=2184000 RepID=UPI000E0BE76F|nr:biliverdin-producing heme oxygenase [Flavobacterium sp. AG291]RDI13384.1 heme oxygenase [Flavobacterium sp. AG291]
MNTLENSTIFLENLRKATSQSHTNLEALPISSSIMNPKVTNAEYALYLDLMHDVVKDAEENIFPALKDIVTDLDERNKTHLLEEDLKTLGLTKKDVANPLSDSLTNPSKAFAMGVFYVIEGSSLGGRVILKNISAALGHDIENGAAYFGGYGGQTGSYWKNFLAQLTQYESQSNSSEEIIAGADYAFNAISNHFNKSV